MATAELAPRIDSAQPLEPGITEAKFQRNPVLPSQQLPSGPSYPSNVFAEFISPDKLPNPRPERVLFGGLKDLRLAVVEPIPLDVTLEESNVVVSWADVAEFGTGETLSVAIDDFDTSLRELYYQLLAPEARLGADLARIKQIIEQHIQPRK
jgi:hypothetical protein